MTRGFDKGDLITRMFFTLAQGSQQMFQLQLDEYETAPYSIQLSQNLTSDVIIKLFCF
jgi:hypothetical protein